MVDFWGILILAAKVEKGGVAALFDKGKEKLLDKLPSIDLSDRMKKYRFEQLKRVIPTAFHGDDEADPWYPIKSLIDGFNNNRVRKIAASYCKVHDESMSAFKPLTNVLDTFVPQNCVADGSKSSSPKVMFGSNGGD